MALFQFIHHSVVGFDQQIDFITVGLQNDFLIFWFKLVSLSLSEMVFKDFVMYEEKNKQKECHQ
jgi:hypothetical protein